MEKIIITLMVGLAIVACTPSEKPAETTPEPVASTVQLPYTASFSSQFSQDVSDQDLFMVLNSYKHWETGDLKALRSTLADSITFEAADGFTYTGPADGLMQRWTASRDSLSSVQITMHAWVKLRSTDKNNDFVTVWYTEIDTYKDGKIDSAHWSDVNMVTNGKISWYAQHKRTAK
jgi:ketosteroid isomerase-like protein